MKDEDQYLRIEAIRALATIDNPVTRQALRDAMLDAQPLVQQAAEAAMRALTNSDTVAAAADEAGDTVRLTVLASQLSKPPVIAPAPPAASASTSGDTPIPKSASQARWCPGTTGVPPAPVKRPSGPSVSLIQP